MGYGEPETPSAAVLNWAWKSPLESIGADTATWLSVIVTFPGGTSVPAAMWPERVRGRGAVGDRRRGQRVEDRRGIVGGLDRNGGGACGAGGLEVVGGQGIECEGHIPGLGVGREGRGPAVAAVGDVGEQAVSVGADLQPRQAVGLVIEVHAGDRRFWRGGHPRGRQRQVVAGGDGIGAGCERT